MGIPSPAASRAPAVIPAISTPKPTAAKVITSFQSGHGWTATAGATGTTNDTSQYVRGTQCISMLTKGAGVQASVRNTAITSFSAANCQLRITMKLTNVVNLQTLSIYAGDTGLANYYLWTLQSATATPEVNYFQEGEWITMTMDWHSATSSGSPNRTAITCMQISAYDNNTGQLVGVAVQSVELVADQSVPFPNGVISITFDDSWDSPYTLGKQELDKYGYPATVYHIWDLLDTSGRATTAQIQNAEGYCGWENGAHAATLADHAAWFTTMSVGALEEDFRRQHEAAASKGIRLDGLAYPNGAHNAAIVALMKKYFSYGRTIVPKIRETPLPGNPFKLRASSSISAYAGGVPVATLTTATTGYIDLTKANKSWLILVFHKITAGAATSTSECAQADLATILAAINTAGVPVMTVRDVLRKAAAL